MAVPGWGEGLGALVVGVELDLPGGPADAAAEAVLTQRQAAAEVGGAFGAGEGGFVAAGGAVRVEAQANKECTQ